MTAIFPVLISVRNKIPATVCTFQVILSSFFSLGFLRMFFPPIPSAFLWAEFFMSAFGWLLYWFTAVKTQFTDLYPLACIKCGSFSKPSHILLKVPHTVQNCAVTVCTSAQSDCAEMTSMIMQKCTSNQRNKNNLNDNHLIRTNSSRLSLGEYQNVFLTEKEYKRLKADFAGLDGLIEQLSAYIQSTGKKYADHAATLSIWAKRQNAEKKTAPGIPDYTFAEGESL